MTRQNDQENPVRRESARHRALLGTAMGLCLAVRSAASDQAAEIQNFAVRPDSGAVLLTWTVPPGAMFSRVRVRFKVDESAPGSSNEGFALLDVPTSAGTIYRARHSRLSPQHSYAYAAFGLDESGVVRSSSTAVATPLPVKLPAAVRNLRRVDVMVDSVAATTRRDPQ